MLVDPIGWTSEYLALDWRFAVVVALGLLVPALAIAARWREGPWRLAFRGVAALDLLVIAWLNASTTLRARSAIESGAVGGNDFGDARDTYWLLARVVFQPVVASAVLGHRSRPVAPTVSADSGHRGAPKLRI